MNNKETEIKYLNQDEIRDFIMQKDYKIYKLQQRINKAIEYIERNCLEFNKKYACQGLNNDKVDVLLDILRGEDE